MGSSNNLTNEDELLLSRVYNDLDVRSSPSVQSLVWRYNKFGDKLRDIENRKLCDHMKRYTFNSTDMHFALVQIHKYK
jgi:hypothetical protein